jgi:hypothetical protein
MGSAGRTFVVRVDPGDGTAVVEDVRTRERARLADLSQVGERIAAWIAASEPRAGDGDEPGAQAGS